MRTTIVFFVVLRRELPLPSSILFASRAGDPDVRIVEADNWTTKPPPPEPSPGGATVRAWQSLTDGTHMREPLDLTDNVVSLVVGRLGSKTKPSDQDDPPPRTQTVLELSAVLSDRRDAAQHAFRRAWRLAEDLSRAHAVASGCSSDPLALSDAFPVSLFLTRDRRGWHRDSVSQYLITENLDHLVPRTLDDEHDISAFFVFARRLRSNDPWALYAERRAASRRAMLSGQFSDAIIESAVAAEIIFDVVLGWALWESGTTTMDAATPLKRPLMERLRSEMHPRLGGTWDLTNTPELSGWHSSIARLRNRIVHRGYRPSEREASEAVAAGDALASFLVARVTANVTKYPKMAISVLGAPGLKDRGLYSRRVDLAFRAAGPTGDIPLIEYQSWRESVDALVA
jgi:hypothetical protein